MTTTNNQLTVTFELNVEPNPAASKAAGRPIFKEQEVCKIRFAGDRQKVAVFPAHEAEPNATRDAGKANSPFAHYREGEIVTYAMLYNDQYKAFKAGEAQPMSGTPLSEAPFLTESKRRELKAMNVHTVEALAAIDGTPLRQLGMGGREMKNQAQAYLDRAAGSADVTALAADNAALRAQLQEQREMIDEYTKVAARTKEQRLVERDFAKEQAAEAEEQRRVDLAVQKRAAKSDATWQKQTEKAERGQITASTDFAKWSDDQLRDFVERGTGNKPRANASRESLETAAKELRDAK